MLLRKLGPLLALLLLVPLQWAQPQAATAAASPVAAALRTGPAFDVKAATDAYLATVPPYKKARSDAYFDGGYWLQLWDLLLGSAIVIFLLHGRLSSRMRNWAHRLSSWRGIQDLISFLQFLVITTVLQFPLTVYEGYIREHKYGLAPRPSGPGCGIRWSAWRWVQSSAGSR
jgi:STE24 endopeptidase